VPVLDDRAELTADVLNRLADFGQQPLELGEDARHAHSSLRFAPRGALGRRLPVRAPCSASPGRHAVVQTAPRRAALTTSKVTRAGAAPSPAAAPGAA